MGYWARPDQVALGSTNWAMAVSPPIMDYFESYFDEEYAIAKLGKPNNIYKKINVFFYL